MKYEVEIIRSNRKTVAIEVTPDLRILARVPECMPQDEVRCIVTDRADWIKNAIAKIKSKATVHNTPSAKFTDGDIAELKKQARCIVTERVEHFAPIIGVGYNRIAIRSQTTRWGSCSSKRNLNFNCLLALCPTEVIDYVVVHELCHLLELNHSPRFWHEVCRVLPDYKTRRKWLRDNSSALISRIK